MDSNVLAYFQTQGPFAVLFIWLLMYVMRTNKDRETRLQARLDKFTDKYDVIITEIRNIKSHNKN